MQYVHPPYRDRRGPYRSLFPLVVKLVGIRISPICKLFYYTPYPQNVTTQNRFFVEPVLNRFLTKNTVFSRNVLGVETVANSTFSVLLAESIYLILTIPRSGLPAEKHPPGNPAPP